MMHQTQGHTDAVVGELGARLLAALALGLLAAFSWRCISATHARRSGSRPHELPERLQTWEGEGGRPVDTDDGDARLHPEPLPHVAGGDLNRS